MVGVVSVRETNRAVYSRLQPTAANRSLCGRFQVFRISLLRLRAPHTAGRSETASFLLRG